MYLCSASGKPTENFGGVFGIWDRGQGHLVGSEKGILRTPEELCEGVISSHIQGQLHGPLQEDDQRAAQRCHVVWALKCSLGLQL